MTKSGLLIALAAAVALSGLGLGALAYWSVPGAGAQTGRLPELTAWMPASASFVAHVDLASLASSPLWPLWEDWEDTRSRERALEKIDEFREATGMDPWTDFHALSVSVRPSERGQPKDWGLALRGELDPDRIISLIEEHEELERVAHGNDTLHVFRNRRGRHEEQQAVAFPESTLALFGAPETVKDMLDTGQGRASSAADGTLAEWLQELPPDSTFWCAGSVQDGFNPLSFRGGRGGQDTPSMPPLQSFAVSGKLDTDVTVNARGVTADPEAARKLADVVRGFVALGSLQRHDRPELQSILESIQIQTFENRVEVAVTVPYETLRRLAASSRKAEE